MEFIHNFMRFIITLLNYLFGRALVPQVAQPEIIVECHGCRRSKDEEGKRLNLTFCAECRLVKFCSAKCKSDNRSKHKIDCRKGEIKILSDKVEELACELRNYSEFGEPPENLFEMSVGRFWGMIDTRDYCRARYKLANELCKIGSEENCKESYEAALSHYLELLRLSPTDNLGLRFKVPFVLLNLNRDQDSYDFVKWWLTVDPNRVNIILSCSREGDWPYMTNQNMLEDLSKALKKRSTGPHFAAALALIKSRLIENCENFGLHNPHVGKEQAKHLRGYLRQIDCHILARMYAEPYLNFAFSFLGQTNSSDGDFTEEDILIEDSKRLFENNEVAKKEILKIFS